jgi:hypothetical protein
LSDQRSRESAGPEDILAVVGGVEDQEGDVVMLVGVEERAGGDVGEEGFVLRVVVAEGSEGCGCGEVKNRIEVVDRLAGAGAAPGIVAAEEEQVVGGEVDSLHVALDDLPGLVAAGVSDEKVVVGVGSERERRADEDEEQEM